ncbi:response regulator transcription factor [Oceanicella sp. SM1341]|uniref:response regulator transcription factor n=1 Tax=Oceanicella sp. SM1341 TaxID=1548889 RepID=UPI0013005314|nr:response regulator [Oceanicella sp. SM1341]
MALVCARPLISVIDDDEGVRLALEDMFCSRGYDVCCFASAEAFLASPARRGTAFVVSDIQMPGMGGLEMVRVLRRGGATVAVVLISAFATPQVHARVARETDVRLIEKPFDPPELLRLVEALTGRAAP